jgi:hypothetical protein
MGRAIARNAASALFPPRGHNDGFSAHELSSEHAQVGTVFIRNRVSLPAGAAPGHEGSVLSVFQHVGDQTSARPYRDSQLASGYALRVGGEN